MAAAGFPLLQQMEDSRSWHSAPTLISGFFCGVEPGDCEELAASWACSGLRPGDLADVLQQPPVGQQRQPALDTQICEEIAWLLQILSAVAACAGVR